MKCVYRHARHNFAGLLFSACTAQPGIRSSMPMMIVDNEPDMSKALGHAPICNIKCLFIQNYMAVRIAASILQIKILMNKLVYKI